MKLQHLLSLCLIMNISGQLSADTDDAAREREAEKVHRRVLTIDTHVDAPMVMIRPGFDMRERHDVLEEQSQVDIPRMIEGGLDGAFFSVYVGQGPRTISGRTEAKEKAMNLFNMIHSMIEESPEHLELALTADDAPRIRDAGKRAIYIGIENGYVLGRDLDLVEKYYDLGARYITLAHTRNNEICDSSTDSNGPEHGGISDFGRLVIREMNRLGIMVDVSHISDDAVEQAIELSEAPVIASHSSAHAIYPHPRNINDELLRKIAETGGVIQMNMYSGYLIDTERDPERREALREWREEFGDLHELSPERQEEAKAARKALEKEFPRHLATIDDVMEHVDHIVDVVGVDHVGFGADFDGGGGVHGCNDVSEIGNLTLALVERGYSEEEIGKIWSGNVLRVLRENEKVAERIQADLAAAGE